MKKHIFILIFLACFGLCSFFWRDLVGKYYQVKFGEQFNKVRETTSLRCIRRDWEFKLSDLNIALWLSSRTEDVLSKSTSIRYRGKEQIFRLGRIQLERDSYLVRDWNISIDSTLDSAIIILEVDFTNSKNFTSRLLLVDQKVKAGVQEVQEPSIVKDMIARYRE